MFIELKKYFLGNNIDGKTTFTGSASIIIKLFAMQSFAPTDWKTTLLSATAIEKVGYQSCRKQIGFIKVDKSFMYRIKSNNNPRIDSSGTPVLIGFKFDRL